MRSLKKCFVELEPSLSLSLSCRHGERHGLFLRTGCLPGFRGSCSFVVSSPGSRPIRWFPRRRKESLFFLLFSLLFVFAAWTSPKKNGTTLPLDQVQARIFDPLLSDFSSGENFSSTINYIIIVFDCASYFVIYWTLTSVVLPRRRGPLNGFYPSTYSSSPSLSPTDPHHLFSLVGALHIYRLSDDEETVIRRVRTLRRGGIISKKRGQIDFHTPRFL